MSLAEIRIIAEGRGRKLKSTEFPALAVVSRGQTLFRTEGKGLGCGHRATCRPTPWSAYQSQHSIQSHDT